MAYVDFLNRVEELIQEFGGGKQILFAEHLGIRQSLLSNWKLKGSYPSVETLLLMKEKLGVSVDWLLTGEGRKYIPSSAKKEPHYSAEEKRLIDLYRDASPDFKLAAKNVLGFDKDKMALPMVAERTRSYGPKKKAK